MAIVEVKVPQLSESVAEATLMTWKKKPGDAVAMDEILIEVETDKVVLEVPAPAAGVMAELVEADGATVASEQVIARIDTDGVGLLQPRQRRQARRRQQLLPHPRLHRHPHPVRHRPARQAWRPQPRPSTWPTTVWPPARLQERAKTVA